MPSIIYEDLCMRKEKNLQEFLREREDFREIPHSFNLYIRYTFVPTDFCVNLFMWALIDI